jgi:hypothetical protein
MEHSTNAVRRAVTTAGLVITIVFVGSAVVFANSHYHTSQREGSWGVLAASSCLELLWAVFLPLFIGGSRPPYSRSSS